MFKLTHTHLLTSLVWEEQNEAVKMCPENTNSREVDYPTGVVWEVLDGFPPAKMKP